MPKNSEFPNTQVQRLAADVRRLRLKVEELYGVSAAPAAALEAIRHHTVPTELHDAHIPSVPDLTAAFPHFDHVFVSVAAQRGDFRRSSLEQKVLGLEIAKHNIESSWGFRLLKPRPYRQRSCDRFRARINR